MNPPEIIGQAISPEDMREIGFEAYEIPQSGITILRMPSVTNLGEGHYMTQWGRWYEIPSGKIITGSLKEVLSEYKRSLSPVLPPDTDNTDLHKVE